MKLVNATRIIEEEYNKYGCDPAYYDDEEAKFSKYLIETLSEAEKIDAGKPVISKDCFVEILTEVKNFQKFFAEIREVLDIGDDDADLIYLFFDKIVDALIKELETGPFVEKHDIPYICQWLYNDKNVNPWKDAGELYDFLIRERENNKNEYNKNT